jgi:hypothetical protein
MSEIAMSPETSTMLMKAREEYAIAEISNDQYIAGIQAKVLALPPATEKEGYELRRKTIADLRKIRTTIEARRKELKADSLSYGRRIDAFAKHWTAQIEEIEQPLVLEKQAVDEAKEKAKREAEEAERRKQEEEARQRIQAEEARLSEIRKVEEAKLAEEREKLRRAAELLRQEAEAQEAERRKAEADHLARLQEIGRQQQETAAKQKAEEERIASLRHKFEDEQRAADEFAAKVKAEREEKEQAAQREKERLARAERIKPDIVKLREYAEKLVAIPTPKVNSTEAKEILVQAGVAIQSLVWRLTHI